MPGIAQAQTCTAVASNLNFGQVSPVAGTTASASSTITINCTGMSVLPVRACVNIGTGSGGGSYLPRIALNGTNQLQYNLYTASGGSTVWGSRGSTTYAPIAVDITENGMSGTGSATLTVYGRVPASQTSLVAGTYASSFAGALQAELDYQAYLLVAPACASLTAPNSAFSFTVSANVINDCTIASTNINFGTAGVLNSTLTATGTLTVACTKNDAYSISLSPGAGSGASVADRVMTRSGGTDKVHYQLYQNASYSLPWGDGTNGTTALTGTGTGSSQSITVYARVLPQTTPQAGTYIDTVIATITY
ncbi:spore coat protein U domain-containing protein [Paraburkholderia sp. Tr-20389]|nr:spore coat protein U domain-containing protein [Paraburkholderia sp. Tr-20389]